MISQSGDLLKTINNPKDLKKLKKANLPQLAKELRQYLIDTISIMKSAHFGASLGVVELTVALHYVFNTPYDQLVWDVGHQAYGHKVLTGRKDTLHTNRRYKGISGFPKRSESEYDAFGVGHASTSISAALGMAIASKLRGIKEKQHVAIIGDGAMTAGLSFEALNHAGVSDTNLLVILNDNCMSIDPNVGALKEYLTDITTSPTYNKFRDDVWNALGRLSKLGPNFQEIASKLESSIKAAILKNSNIFEALNFRYFGPIDGHDIMHLIKVLEDLKDIPGPKLLHCITVKGKGYKQAEKDQTKWHSPGQFNKDTGEILKTQYDTLQAPKYQDVFGNTLVELAEKNEKIIGITPAMPSGSSLNIMMEKMPDRAFDVGIAEQHAVTFSAGLATDGFIPYCNIYSSFMQRGYDQLLHDVAIQNLHVVFCLDRAGLVGEDGATHHGTFDLAYLRCIPNMIISAPLDEIELRNLMYTAQLNKITQPFVIRYPRGQGVIPNWQQPFKEIQVGTGRKLQDGEEVAILSIGPVGNDVTQACRQLIKEEIYPAHYDIRFVKPLDELLLHEIFSNYKKIITVEDGCIMGGMGSAVLEFMANNDYNARVKRLGIPDRFIEHGSLNELHAECGYHPEGIMNIVRDFVNKKVVFKHSLT